MANMSSNSRGTFTKLFEKTIFTYVRAYCFHCGAPCVSLETRNEIRVKGHGAVVKNLIQICNTCDETYIKSLLITEGE